MTNPFEQIIPVIKEKMLEDKFSRILSCKKEITCENAKLLINELQKLSESNNNLVESQYENSDFYKHDFKSEIKLVIKGAKQSDEYDTISGISFFKDKTTNILSGYYIVNKFKRYYSHGPVLERKRLKFNDLCIVKTDKDCFKHNEK